MQRRGRSFIRPYRPAFLEYHLMQAPVMFVTRLFRLPLERTTPVKTKKQMYNDSTNKNEGNDCECQDVCNHVKHIIPRLSLFVARSRIANFYFYLLRRITLNKIKFKNTAMSSEPEPRPVHPPHPCRGFPGRSFEVF